MSDSLIQRRLLASSILTVEYNGIRIVEKGLNKQFSYFVPFEEIPSAPFSLRIYDKVAIMLAVVCGVFALIIAMSFISAQHITLANVLFVLLLAGIPTAITWFTRKELTGFGVPGQGLVLRANRPSPQAVQAFLQLVRQAKITYLREMYFDKVVPDNPADEMKMLLWLKNQEAISSDEFEVRKQKVAPLKTTGSIGFHANKHDNE
jgi:hypothetical protein